MTLCISIIVGLLFVALLLYGCLVCYVLGLFSADLFKNIHFLLIDATFCEIVQSCRRRNAR